MSEPILVTCTECHKQLRVPASAAGKKVRCKNCKAVIPVVAPPAKGTFEEEMIEGKKPYGVTETSLANRCPFCANDIDPPDSKICLYCGYDLEQRGRREHKVVYERTAGDFILWHLPTLAAAIGMVAVVLGFLFYHYWLPEYVLSEKDAASIKNSRWSYFDDDQADWTGIMFHWGIEVWLIVIGAFTLWRCGKFLYIRLFREFLPQERIKKL